jgi:hypothetical protein
MMSLTDAATAHHESLRVVARHEQVVGRNYRYTSVALGTVARYIHTMFLGVDTEVSPTCMACSTP